MGLHRTVAIRVFLLAFGAAATVFALLTARPHAGGGARYACPMHPAITSDVPRDCTICGMALVPLARSSLSPSTPLDVVSLPQDVPDVPRHDVSGARRQQLVRRIRAAAWLESPRVVTARVYEEEVRALRPGDHGAFVPTDASSAAVDVRLIGSDVNDPLEPTGIVRLEVAPPVDALQPGRAGWIDLGDHRVDALVVAADAILESPAGPYVIAVSPDGRTLSRKAVRLGRVAGGLAVVQSGLAESAQVVVMDAFFFEAERRRLQGEGPSAPTGSP